jgi:hypothetical protein
VSESLSDATASGQSLRRRVVTVREVDMSGDQFSVPTAFWATLTFEEFSAIARSGSLTRAQTLRAWQMAGKRGPPPVGRAVVYLHRKDVERVVKEYAQRLRPN